jgi:glycerol uptake facilitator-like aquaporin
MSQNQEHRKKYVAEVLSTICLVFAGTGAIVINEVSGGMVTHVGVALAFGLVVMSMLYAVNHENHESFSEPRDALPRPL